MKNDDVNKLVCLYYLSLETTIFVVLCTLKDMYLCVNMVVSRTCCTCV